MAAQCTYEWNKQCGDYRKQGYSPTDYFENVLHPTGITTFTLVVDDFGVKYVGKEHVDHLIACIKEKYKLTKDWTGDLYCGINLKWNYTAQTLEISMPGYIK